MFKRKKIAVLILLLILPILFVGCSNSDFDKKLTCSEFIPAEEAKVKEGYTDGDITVSYSGGVVFYSPTLDTCVGISGFYIYAPDNSSSIISFADLLTNDSIASFDSTSYGDITEFADAWQGKKAELLGE